MKRKILDWQSWLYGLVAGAIGGGATAIVSIAGGQVIGAADFTPRQLLTIAGVSAIVNAALYLKQSPLPKLIEREE